MCVCGATNVLADDLLPNKTLRDTIVRILQSNNSSGDNGHVAIQTQVGGILLFCYSSNSWLSLSLTLTTSSDMESARCPQPKILSPMQSETWKVDVLSPKNEHNMKIRVMTEPVKIVNSTHNIFDKLMVEKAEEISESMREPGSPMSVSLTDEKVQQKLGSEEVGET